MRVSLLSKDGKISSFVLLLSQSVRVEGNEKVQNLQNFLEFYDFSILRGALKSLHRFTTLDKIRGNYRFSMGFAELMTYKTRFDKPIVHVESGMVYPRISQIQLDGGHHMSVVLDGVLRLLTLSFRAVEETGILQNVQSKIHPLVFPALISKSNIFKPTAWKRPEYQEAIDCTSRISIVLWEASSASEDSDIVRQGLLTKRRTNKKTEKFETAEPTYFHVDGNDADGVQTVVVVAHNIPEEVFVVADPEEDGHNVMYFNIDESEGLRLYVFGCNFLKQHHGNIRLHDNYKLLCPPDAWMIRITPYATQHIEKWATYIKQQPRHEQGSILQQLYQYEV